MMYKITKKRKIAEEKVNMANKQLIDMLMGLGIDQLKLTSIGNSIATGDLWLNKVYLY